MIIDNRYFVGEIYISHANPSASDDVLDVEDELQIMIDDYARECLLKCLGYDLFNLFSSELKSDETNGLKPTADEKWDFLLNGHSYTNSDGKDVVWRGIRFKSNPTKDHYNKSFLANYVYWFYERDYESTRSNVGHTKQKSANAEVVLATPKVVKAWNKFVEMVQGSDEPVLRENHGLKSVDWFGKGGSEISLYRFIREMNQIEEDYYPGFEPKTWKTENQFGL